MIGALPFGVVDQVPGEIEDSLAGEFVLPQVHAVPAKHKRRRWPVFDGLPSVKPHVQNKGALHFNEEIPLCRQCIEWSIGAPMPFPGLLRFATQMFLDTVQQFDRALFLTCSQKFQKLRVRPYQGHRTSCGFARFQSALRHGRAVPNLLGNKPSWPRHPRHHLEVRQRIAAKLQLEMAALAGKQRPGSADAIAVVGATVRMLTIAILVITMIGNAQRRFDLEQRVGDLGRVLNPVIIGAPQPQASQVEILHPDERDRRHALTPLVGHVHAAAQAALHCGGPDPHVIAVDPVLGGKWCSRDIGPVLDPLVPVISERKDKVAFSSAGKFGRGNQRDNLDCQGERANAGILFPTVLWADWSILNEVADSAPDHGIHATQSAQRILFRKFSSENDGKADLVELNATPEWATVWEAVLVPASVPVLNGDEVRQHARPSARPTRRCTERGTSLETPAGEGIGTPKRGPSAIGPVSAIERKARVSARTDGRASRSTWRLALLHGHALFCMPHMAHRDRIGSCEPVSAPNSLLTGKLTGNFAESDPPLRFRRPVSE